MRHPLYCENESNGRVKFDRQQNTVYCRGFSFHFFSLIDLGRGNVRISN